ncbi:MAG: serine protease [Clostridia bacterium]|nr:serine protease [Clostridia bacterium]
MKKKTIIINYVILGLLFVFNIFASVYFISSYKTEDIFNNNILKVVEIKVSDDEITWGYATGFFIDNNGTILTNKHVAYNSITNANYNLIQVRLANEDEWLVAEVVKISDDNDLATIKIDKSDTNYFELEENFSNGETIFTIGNPNGFGLSFTTGVISSSERNVIYNEQTIKTMQTSFVINEGNSGGPVFNKCGKLLGIISFRLKDRNEDVIQGVSFALPSLTIKLFIQG